MISKPLAARAAALAVLSGLVLTACHSTNVEATPENPYALKDSSKLTVCADMPYAPFEFMNAQREITGFDMELADAIAADLKVEKDVIVTPFEQIQSASALNANDCDVAISSISMTDARKTKMAFSTPYYSDNLGLMVPKSSPVKNLAEAKKVKIGVVAGTTGADFAEEKGVDATIFKDTGTLIQGLQSGQVHGAIGNRSVLGYTAGEGSPLHFIEEYETGETLGIALKKGNEPLLKAVNESLKRYESSGRLAESKKRWFGAGS
ncbi:ABC transporter substrate-binding protein [Falsarthrobacter nasiphocae]|uniref:Polar amino acid transport system substrate-binding protein n=1 Tax=Falsarthrobacter nasiphocae TaxID=189863 RepID=A0AAE4C6R3_9MICC|nr:ABC transporter substrate-binding protein [Falsarthrobacter nasiphocae]MDR6892432.1 polar amino acid transport system substrate-binding protein [Falsarthrobacter nasiphocae]